MWLKYNWNMMPYRYKGRSSNEAKLASSIHIICDIIPLKRIIGSILIFCSFCLIKSYIVLWCYSITQAETVTTYGRESMSPKLVDEKCRIQFPVVLVDIAV